MVTSCLGCAGQRQQPRRNSRSEHATVDIFPPDRMMIIADDGTEKHERMFTLRNGLIRWWKPSRWTDRCKGPFTLIAVQQYGTGNLLKLVTRDGDAPIVRPRDYQMRNRWLDAVKDPADDELSDPGSNVSDPSPSNVQGAPSANGVGLNFQPATAGDTAGDPVRELLVSSELGDLVDIFVREGFDDLQTLKEHFHEVMDSLKQSGVEVPVDKQQNLRERLDKFSQADSMLEELRGRDEELRWFEQNLRWREEKLRRSEEELQRQHKPKPKWQTKPKRKLQPKAEAAAEAAAEANAEAEAIAEAEAAEARHHRRLEATQRWVASHSQLRRRPPNGVTRRRCRDFDIALYQRVKYLSESQNRWVSATVTRLNSDLSIDLDGDDGSWYRENCFVFRNGRQVIR